MRGLTAARALRRIALLPALLIGVDFLDELWSGVPAVGSPGCWYWRCAA